jgi:His-Xaa-Ser system protein HxsD
MDGFATVGLRPAERLVVFSASVYSIEAVKRAAYRFTDRFTFDISVAGDEIRCVVTPLRELPAEELTALEPRLRNEVLDQDLRERIAAETSGVRNAILAYAFSATGLQNVE